MGELKKLEIMGISLPVYLLVTALVFVTMILGWMPKDMIGAFAVIMVLGGLFNTISNHTPAVRTYLDDGVIVCIFAPATLVIFGVIPEAVIESVDGFTNTIGFLNFYIVTLITGSILGMNRSLLLRAAVRLLPVVLCAMTFTILVVGFVGTIMGYEFADAVTCVVTPVMSDGVGTGVVPLSGMYVEALGRKSAVIISYMISAFTLENICATAGASLLAKLGEVKPGLTGNGKLMRKDMEEMTGSEMLSTSVQIMGISMILAPCFYLVGTMINKLVPSIHTYARMIVAVATSKALGIIPFKSEQVAKQQSGFMMGNWTQALLVGIGISTTDLNAVVSAFSLTYTILVLMVVDGVALGAGVGGYLVGFYPVEPFTMAGLCTTNIGGTEGIAVLSVVRRAELLLLAQIATGVCGALTLIVASMLVKVLL